MRKNTCLLLIVMVLGLGFFRIGKIEAKTVKPTASPSATVTPTIIVEEPSTIINSENITEPKSEKVNYEVGKWNGFNSAKVVIKWAIDRGVATNTIVLLFLLPLIATLVSVLHYVVGLSGYGIFMPTMIAVTFLATGIFGGLMLFAMILLISILSNLFFKEI